MKKILIAATALTMACGAHAQLSGSVSVEGEYAPLIIETERLNNWPKGFRFDLPAANLDYEYTGIVADFRPSLLSMGVTGRQTDWPGGRRRGYVDLRMGSRLNTRLRAGYALYADSVSTLALELRYGGSSLFRTHAPESGYTKYPLKRLYDGRIGLNYARVVGQQGLLQASAGYRLAYFNYYGTTFPLDEIRGERGERGESGESGGRRIPTQTLNGADAAVSYASSPSLTEGWHAGASFNYMAYRRLYGTERPAGYGESRRGDRETELKIEGGYNFRLNDKSAVAIDAEGDFLFYTDRRPEVLGITDPGRKNYGIISIKPGYRFAGDAVTLRAGIDLAAGYDAMGKRAGEDFASVHVAPDVVAEYHSPAGVGLFAEARGGVTPATLAMREKDDRYMMPWVLSTTPVYTPIDARIGLTAGSFAGFTGKIAFRYAAMRNVPLGGWYQAYIGSCTPGLELTPAMMTAFTDPYLQSADLHGVSVELDLRYAYGTIVELDFNTTYTPQKGTTGICNGLDRPRWVMRAHAGIRPMKRLKIDLAYDYRGVRNCYYYASTAGKASLAAYRLDDITDLSAKVTYSVLDNLDIYIKGENLLNRHPWLLPGLQSEGLALLGGIFFTF